jgi:hypothetical protein
MPQSLLKRTPENNEVPIAFMSSTFKGVELNYPAVDQTSLRCLQGSQAFPILSFEVKDEDHCPLPCR